MLLYSTLPCKKTARATGGRKKYKPTKLGGGGRSRKDPKTDVCKSSWGDTLGPGTLYSMHAKVY